MTENVLKPAYNAGVVTPVNAVGNAARMVTGFPDLPRLEFQHVKEAEMLSPEWFAQNASTGLAAVGPYVLAGKFACRTMRAGGTMLALEGGAGRLAASEFAGNMMGAVVLDGFRDVHKGETRLGNMIGGATAFGIFGGLNPLTANLNLAARIGTRMAVGSTGASTAVVASDLISTGKLPDSKRLSNAALSGAFMNSVLPPAQNRVGKAFDHFESRIVGSTPVSRFVSDYNLAGSPNSPLSRSLAQFSQELPLMNVRTKPGAGGSNTIDMDAALLSGLRSPHEPTRVIAQEQAARHIGERLASTYRSRHGIPEGVLTNTGIETALRQGRLEVHVKDSHGVEQPLLNPSIRHVPEIGANALDVHLAPDFIIPPAGTKPIDLRATPPKQVIAEWPIQNLPEGITLQPGQFVLASTSERIVLPAGPEPHWHGHPPLIGDINSRSSIARMGIEVHQTAPTLNSGTNNRITLEIVNNSPMPITLRPGEAIASIVFRTLTGHPEGVRQTSHFNGQQTPNGLRARNTNLEGTPLRQTEAAPVSVSSTAPGSAAHDAVAGSGQGSRADSAVPRGAGSTAADAAAFQPPVVPRSGNPARLGRSALETVPPDVLAQIHDTPPPAGTGQSSRGDGVVPRGTEIPSSGQTSTRGDLTVAQQGQPVVGRTPVSGTDGWQPPVTPGAVNTTRLGRSALETAPPEVLAQIHDTPPTAGTGQNPRGDGVVPRGTETPSSVLTSARGDLTVAQQGQPVVGRTPASSGSDRWQPAVTPSAVNTTRLGRSALETAPADALARIHDTPPPPGTGRSSRGDAVVPRTSEAPNTGQTSGKGDLTVAQHGETVVGSTPASGAGSLQPPVTSRPVETTRLGRSALNTVPPEVLAQIHDAPPPTGTGQSSRGDAVVPRGNDSTTPGVTSGSGELTVAQQRGTRPTSN